jgi:hypothetical protein
MSVLHKHKIGPGAGKGTDRETKIQNTGLPADHGNSYNFRFPDIKP